MRWYGVELAELSWRITRSDGQASAPAAPLADTLADSVAAAGVPASWASWAVWATLCGTRGGSWEGVWVVVRAWGRGLGRGLRLRWWW